MSTEPSPTVEMISVLRGGVVDNPEVAVKIAELLISNHYGEEELKRQRPLIALDQNDRWIIEGSFNRDRTKEGIGPAKVIVKKYDCQVLELNVPVILLSLGLREK